MKKEDDGKEIKSRGKVRVSSDVRWVKCIAWRWSTPLSRSAADWVKARAETPEGFATKTL